jgi:hypothetical protein
MPPQYAEVRKDDSRGERRLALCIVATDPDGNRVVCHTDTWTGRIEAEHPEMANRMSWVGETSAQPMAIYRSARDADTKVFHRQYDFEGGLGRVMLRVVVRYRRRWRIGQTEGTIVTAFAASGPKAGEVLIWPR